MPTSEPGDKLTWRKLLSTGDIPSKRAGHAAVAISNNKLFVHGGKDSTGTFLFDSYILNLGTIVYSMFFCMELAYDDASPCL